MEILDLAAPTIRVADHFPSVLPPCKEQAAKFFHCFTNSAKENRLVRFRFLAFFFSDHN